MRTIRRLSVLVLALGFLSIFWSSTKNDAYDLRPVVCGFPGSGNVALNEFQITRAERYAFGAYLPALHESNSSSGNFIYPDAEKALPCDLDITIRSLSGKEFLVHSKIRSMEFGSASNNEFGYWSPECRWQFPKGRYEIKISSNTTSPLVAARGGYLALTTTMPSWYFDRVAFLAFGCLLAVIGTISNFIFELKSP